MKRQAIRVWIAALTLLLLAGCTTTHRWNQEIAMFFTTPNGEVRASVVHSMSVRIDWKLTKMLIGDYGRIARIKGEALVADLGDGNVLFALRPGAFFAERAGLLRYRNGMGRSIRRLQDKDPVVITGNTRSYGDIRPWLVTFGDLSDPTSLEIVDPDDLEAVFGPGYALKSITLAGVDAPRTQGRIETVLPLLEEWSRTSYAFGKTPKGLNPVPKKYMVGPKMFDSELYK